MSFILHVYHCLERLIYSLTKSLANILIQTFSAIAYVTSSLNGIFALTCKVVHPKVQYFVPVFFIFAHMYLVISLSLQDRSRHGDSLRTDTFSKVSFQRFCFSHVWKVCSSLFCDIDTPSAVMASDR